MSEIHAESVLYVRDTMLPQKEPPATEVGAIKWIRENLLSGWMNIILTVLSIAFIYWLVMHLAPWLLHSVWDARSLNECREVLDAHARSPETHGACWAVIRERWEQLVFGDQYPKELVWRPILAFVLLFVAILPILFPERTPRAVLALTVAYPFLMPWLIWGGSFWVPVLAAAGFLVGYLAYKALSMFGNLAGLVGGILAALVWWLWLMPLVNDGLHRMIAVSRMDDARAEAVETAEALPADIAVLQEQKDALDAELAEMTATKDGLIAEIRQERFRRQISAELPEIAELLEVEDPDFRTLQRRYSALREILDPFNPAFGSEALGTPVGELRDYVREGVIADTDVDEALQLFETLDMEPEVTDALLERFAEEGVDAEIVERAMARYAETGSDPIVLDDALARFAEMGDLAEQALNVADEDGLSDEVLDAKVDEFQTLMHDITDKAEESLALGAEINLLNNRRTEAERLVRNIDTLGLRQEELPDLRETAETLRAALPEQVANLGTFPEGREAIAALFDESVPDADRRAAISALDEALEAEQDVVNAELQISTTYAEVGRVGLQPVASSNLGGFQLSLIIGVTGIILSLPVGIMLALGRQSHLLIINKTSVTFIEIIRGVPLIVWLMVANFLLNFFLPPGTEFDKVLRVIIMVTLFASAYIAEVIRGGLAALPKGQYEAGDALGLDYWKSMRLIILPQALKISIPGIVNTFIGLFKDTVLVVFIGLLDPLGFSNTIRATTQWNGIYWELFVFIGLMFFIFCYSMGRYSLFLEKKLHRDHR